MYYLLYTILIFLLICFLEFKKKNVFKDSYSLLDSIKNNFSLVRVILSSLLFVSASMILVIIFERLGFISNDIQNFKVSLIPFIIFVSFIVPIIEEYFYRFLPFSLKKFNNVFIYVLVIFISSLIFTSFHNTSTFESVFIFFMAILFSLIYLSTRNIIYSLGCHSFYNLVTLIRSYTGFSNIVFFVIVFFVSLFGLLIYNNRKKVRR